MNRNLAIPLFLFLAVCATGWFVPAAPARAQETSALYFVGEEQDYLSVLSTSDGTATRVGNSTQFGVSENNPTDLAVCPDGTLYMLGGHNDWLSTLDTSTGAATRVGSATDFGVSEGDPTGLACGADGTLFMLGSDQDRLYTLSTSSGAATAVDSAVSRFGLSLPGPWGLAACDGTLYMVDVNSNKRNLYTVGATTGQASLVGALGISGTPTGLGCIGSSLYMVTYGSAGALYTVDTSSGSATRVGSASEFGISENKATGLGGTTSSSPDPMPGTVTIGSIPDTGNDVVRMLITVGSDANKWYTTVSGEATGSISADSDALIAAGGSGEVDLNVGRVWWVADANHRFRLNRVNEGAVITGTMLQGYAQWFSESDDNFIAPDEHFPDGTRGDTMSLYLAIGSNTLEFELDDHHHNVGPHYAHVTVDVATERAILDAVTTGDLVNLVIGPSGALGAPLPSTDATLSALTISSGTLAPVFASATTSYTASVANGVTTVTIGATATDSGATVSGDTGVQTLVVGANTFTVTVTAEDGSSTESYEVVITRAAAALSTDATLSALTISSGTLAPVFASATTSYTASVANGVTTVTIGATATDSGATVSGDTGVQTLVVGANTFTVTVTAEDGSSTESYEVVITRAAAALSTDATLSALSISEGTLAPVFASATMSYAASVANSVATVTIGATATDSGATVSGDTGAQTLTVGANTFTVTVTAEDGSSTESYEVVITRAAAAAQTLTLADFDSAGLEVLSLGLYEAGPVNFPVGTNVHYAYWYVNQSWVPNPPGTYGRLLDGSNAITSGGTIGQISAQLATNVVPSGHTYLTLVADGVDGGLHNLLIHTDIRLMVQSTDGRVEAQGLVNVFPTTTPATAVYITIPSADQQIIQDIDEGDRVIFALARLSGERPPEFASDTTTRTVAENAPAGTNVGAAVTATDPNGGTPTYSISAQTDFTVVPGTGQIQVASGANLDFETLQLHTVTLTATDTTGLTDTIVVEITVTNVDEPASFPPAPITRSVPENSVAGTNVGPPVVAADPESAETFVYSLINGGPFVINSATGQITVDSGASLDHETTPSYSVTVRATFSGTTAQVVVTINVTNVVEPATLVALAIPTASVTRTEARAVVTLVNTDGLNTTVYFRYREQGSSTFSATVSRDTTGTSAAYDMAGLTPGTTYMVQASLKIGFPSAEREMTNFTTLANVGPVFANPTAVRQVDENSLGGTNVGLPVTATHAQADTLTYTLTGAGAASFDINSVTGQITVGNAAVLDHETTPTYTVTVIATDTYNATASVAVTIEVLDLREVGVLGRIVITVGRSGTEYGYRTGSYGTLDMGEFPDDLFSDGNSRTVAEVYEDEDGYWYFTYTGGVTDDWLTDQVQLDEITIEAAYLNGVDSRSFVLGGFVDSRPGTHGLKLDPPIASPDWDTRTGQEIAIEFRRHQAQAATTILPAAIGKPIVQPGTIGSLLDRTPGDAVTIQLLIVCMVFMGSVLIKVPGLPRTPTEILALILVLTAWPPALFGYGDYILAVIVTILLVAAAFIHRQLTKQAR